MFRHTLLHFTNRSTRCVLLTTLMLCTVVASSAAARAGAVRTRDGTTVEGALALRDGKLFVRAADGTERQVELGDVTYAKFRDAPEQAAEAKRDDTGETKIVDRARVKEGFGVRGEYYDRDFHALKQVRMDAQIDFDVPDEEYPGLLIPKDFGARWTGQIRPRYSEKYTFEAQVHSGPEKVRMWVGDKLVIDRWEGRGEPRGSIELKAGERYDLKLEYVDDMFWGRCRLLWSSGRQQREVVPAEYLHPPAGEVNAPPRVRIASPANDTVLTERRRVTIRTETADVDGEVKRAHFFAGDLLLGVAEAAPFQIEATLAAGAHELRVLAVDERGMSETSEPVRVIVGAEGKEALPRPWVQMSVGRRGGSGAGSAGDATHDGGTFTVEGRHGDLWGERESFHFVYQPVGGDVTVVARVRGFAPSERVGALAGLVIREDLNKHNSRQAMVGVTGDGGVVFLRREQEWESRKSNDDGQAGLPRWLKLARHEKVFKAYHSADGKEWQLLNERRIEMGERVFVGLAVACAGEAGGSAVIDNVGFELGPPRMQSSFKGLLMRDGSMVVGTVRSADDTTVKFNCLGRELGVPTSQVARILYRPLTAEAAARIPPGRSGVVLANGDFIDGAVRIRGGEVGVSSVLFGARRFNTYDQTTAIILAEASGGAARFEVTGSDGSVIRAAAVRVEGERLIATDGGDNGFRFSAEQLVELIGADGGR